MMNELVSASRTTALWLALVLGLTGIQDAHAQQAAGEEDAKPRVLLLPTQSQEGVTEVVPGRVDRYLKQLLDISGQAEFFTLETLAVPVVEKRVEVPVEDPKLKKADNLLWDAKEQMGKGKYYRAAAAFKKAMKLYESRFAVLVDFNKYVDAALGVSLAYFYAGQAFEAERALKRVLSHRPDLILDKRKVPKEALEILSRLQQHQGSAALTQVRVESTPPGAEVFIDGIRAGVTPFQARNMVRGTHVVRLVMEGHESYAKSITMSGKGHAIKARLKAIKTKEESAPTFRSPEPLVTLLQQGKLGARFFRTAAQVSAFYGLDHIVMGYARKNKERYEMATFIWEAERNRIAELDWISLDPELSDMQVNLLNLESQVLSGLAAFPTSRELSGPSDIYINVEARRRAAEQKAHEEETRRLQIQIAREAREAERAKKAREKARLEQARQQEREARRQAKAAAAEAARQERERARNAKLAAAEAAKQERLAARNARLARERAEREERAARTAAENHEHDRRVAAEALRARQDREARERREANDRRLAEEERAARRRAAKSGKSQEIARLEELERRARGEAERLAEARRRVEASERDEQARQAREARAAQAREERAAQSREARAAQAREERAAQAREARAAQAREERAAQARREAVVPPTEPPSNALDWMKEQDDGAMATYDASGVWYKKWWVWAGTGAVVAVIGGAMIFSGDDEPDGFRASASW